MTIAWCFNEPMIEAAFGAFHVRKQRENGGGAVNHWRDIIEFLNSPEAREHKLIIDFDPAHEGAIHERESPS